MRFCDTLLMTAAEIFIEIGQTTWCHIHWFHTPQCTQRLRNCYCTVPSPSSPHRRWLRVTSQTNTTEFEDLFERKSSFKTFQEYETSLYQVLVATHSNHHSTQLPPFLKWANSRSCKFSISGEGQGRQIISSQNKQMRWSTRMCRKRY